MFPQLPLGAGAPSGAADGGRDRVSGRIRVVGGGHDVLFRCGRGPGGPLSQVGAPTRASRYTFFDVILGRGHKHRRAG
jgi:hypothetical protein